MGQRKSDIFDLYDTFGNTSELTVHYCINEKPVFLEHLQNNQNKEYPSSTEQRNCVIDIYQMGTFIEMGEHYMSSVGRGVR